MEILQILGFIIRLFSASPQFIAIHKNVILPTSQIKISRLHKLTINKDLHSITKFLQKLVKL